MGSCLPTWSTLNREWHLVLLWSFLDLPRLHPLLVVTVLLFWDRLQHFQISLQKGLLMAYTRSPWLICASTSTRTPTRRTTSQRSTGTSRLRFQSSTMPQILVGQTGSKLWVSWWRRRFC